MAMGASVEYRQLNSTGRCQGQIHLLAKYQVRKKCGHATWFFYQWGLLGRRGRFQICCVWGTMSGEIMMHRMANFLPLAPVCSLPGIAVEDSLWWCGLSTKVVERLGLLMPT